MDEYNYKQYIENLPTGYAYHKIVCDEHGNPCDYTFIEVNEAFEALTGLSRSDIIGRNVSDVLPDLKKDAFNWIQFYGDIAINGGKKEFEQFSKPLNKWYRIKAYSAEKYHFITYVTDITKEMNQIAAMESMVKLSEELLQINEQEIDYQKILDDFAKICDAKYAVFDLFNEGGKGFTTVALTGAKGIIKRASKIAGFMIKGKQWPDDPIRAEKIKDHTITRFTSLDQYVGNAMPSLSISLIMKTFNIGEVILIKIAKNGIMLGDFTLIMGKGQRFDKDIIAELYTRQLGMVIARKQAENALKVNEEKYRLIFEHTPIGVLQFDNKGRITDCNNNFVNIIGSSYQALIGLNILDLPDEKLTATMREALQGKLSIYEGDYRSVTAVKITPVRVMFAPIPTKSNRFETGVGIVEDITEQRKLETALIQEKMLIETTLISVGDGVISTNNSGHIVLMNKAAESLTGWTKEAARGEAVVDVFNVIDAKTREKIAIVASTELDGKQNHESENQILLISKEGLERSIESNVAPILLGNGEVIGLVIVFRDISEKKKKQEEIEFLSYHDQLTGIYNRRFFEEELKRLDTERNLPMSIVMGDVNGLKLINDSFGHGVGDQLLIKVAEMIKRGCRADDIVARLGGDEFVILLPKTSVTETEHLIKRINEYLGKEKIASLDISVSFGYETKTKMDENIQETLKNTEDHMYRHKLSESSSMRSNTIDMIMNTLFEKNHRELLHSKRVSELCENIAIMLNYDKNDVNQIRIAGLMHDIGKIGIAESILNKPLKLNQEEWNEVKRHSEIGYRILSSVNEFSEIADYVLEHHERWDGKGYPRGLKGEQISLKARIIAIADAYDAMTSERTYSKELSKDEAIIEIIRCSGSQFDPDIAKIFVDIILGE